MANRPTCKIRWIDKQGNLTDDTNPAIGFCRTVDRHQMIAGRNVHFPKSSWFPICVEHHKQMDAPGMHIWEFVSYETTNSDEFDGHGNFIRP